MLILRLISRGFCRLSTNIRSTELAQNEPRLLKVAIIGMPNAGKSTLINQLIESEVCPVSKRVHTTRQSQKVVYLRQNTQVVFIDTPGVVNKKEVKKFQFSDDFVTGPRAAIENADIIGVIHDISNRILRHKLDPRVVKVLNQFTNRDAILILNKVDTVKAKRSLLDAVRYLTKSTVGGEPIAMTHNKRPKQLKMEDILARAEARKSNLFTGSQEYSGKEDYRNIDENESDVEINGWAGFNDVFMISALTGDGVDLLKNYFVTNAKMAAWEFSEEILTDCPPMELALKILKSKLLEYLPEEIPYTVVPSLDFWDEDSDKLRVVFGVKCQNERFVKIVIGQGGHNINQITLQVEKSFTRIFQKVIDLHIKVTVAEKEKKL